MDAAVRQLPHVMVTRQVVFASGLMQVLQLRKDTLSLERSAGRVREKSCNSVLSMVQEGEGG